MPSPSDLPSDHPLVADAPLAAHLPAVDELLPPRWSLGAVLRHVEGRRVTLAVEADGDTVALLKVFKSPRARGGHRRLTILEDRLGGLVPTPLAVDLSGHVQVVSWQPGRVYDTLDDAAFVDRAGAVGAALAALHGCGAELDRAWTVTDELHQLQRRATAASSGIAAELATAPLVPAHRDCHPRQVVVADGSIRWIDMDDAAMAPAALDVGNFTAHLLREAIVHGRGMAVARAARAQFLAGYGTVPVGTDRWEQLALLRLVGLAESRHGRTDHALALASLPEIECLTEQVAA
jgi:hypothetical protein